MLVRAIAFGVRPNGAKTPAGTVFEHEGRLGSWMEPVEQGTAAPAPPPAPEPQYVDPPPPAPLPDNPFAEDAPSAAPAEAEKPKRGRKKPAGDDA